MFTFQAITPTGLIPTPQAHWQLQSVGQTVAHCSLWWSTLVADLCPVPPGRATEDTVLGMIGHLEASHPEAALALLDHACQALHHQGCTVALGPMNGTTWHSYRCATDWDHGPPFWGEPQTDPRWVNWLAKAGFAPLVEYESRLCEDLTQTWTPRRRRHRLGCVTLSTAQGLDPERLLPQIYALVMASFWRQPYFQPLPEAVFYQHYRPLLAQLDPALVQLAWDQDESRSDHRSQRLVGLLLSMPDRLAPPTQRRLIVKTLAIWPDRTYAGLGYSLLEAAHQAGAAQGYRQAIHALMHRHNVSINLSRRYSQPFRDYVLMGKPLG